jgi:hypothetical protein
MVKVIWRQNSKRTTQKQKKINPIRKTSKLETSTCINNNKSINYREEKSAPKLIQRDARNENKKATASTNGLNTYSNMHKTENNDKKANKCDSIAK